MRKATCKNKCALYSSFGSTSEGSDASAEAKVKALQNVGKYLSQEMIDKHGIMRIGKKIWIADKARQLNKNVLAKGHFGNSGHRGDNPTESILKRDYT